MPARAPRRSPWHNEFLVLGVFLAVALFGIGYGTMVAVRSWRQDAAVAATPAPPSVDDYRAAMADAAGPFLAQAAKSGAAMVAINEGVPVSCAAIYGSYEWRLGNFNPVSVAWSSPMTFDGLPRGGKGYKEASAEIEREIRRLWEWLRQLHELGRPRNATPPA